MHRGEGKIRNVHCLGAGKNDLKRRLVGDINPRLPEASSDIHCERVSAVRNREKTLQLT